MRTQIAAIACLTAAHALAAPPAASFRLSDDPPVTPREGTEVEFGWLSVPENRADENTRLIEIPVYRFKSTSETPAEDPLLFIAGGPGASILNSVPYIRFWPYLKDRDIIFFDQRGAQYTRPHLNCPDWFNDTREAAYPDTDPETARRIIEQVATNCREYLTQQGTDLAGYTTQAITQDLIDLRKALGIERWNILALSYGTQIAQYLMRDDTEAVRSAVLDSPMPLDRRYDEQSNQAVIEVLDRIYEDCENNPACRNTYPNPRATFNTYLTNHATQPLTIQAILDANQSPPATIELNLRSHHILAILGLGSPGPATDLHARMFRLVEGDNTELVNDAVPVLSPGYGTAMGLRLSVWCADESPFAEPTIIEAETTAHPKIQGRSPAVFDPGVCDCWGVPAADPDLRQPPTTETPTLIISGDYDIFTPLSWAEHLQQTLPSAQLLTFRSWGHTPATNWDNPCAQTAARDFFNDPTTTPTPPCLDEITTPNLDIQNTEADNAP